MGRPRSRCLYAWLLLFGLVGSCSAIVNPFRPTSRGGFTIAESCASRGKPPRIINLGSRLPSLSEKKRQLRDYAGKVVNLRVHSQRIRDLAIRVQAGRIKKFFSRDLSVICAGLLLIISLASNAPIAPRSVKEIQTGMTSLSTVACQPTIRPCTTRAVDQIIELKERTNVLKDLDVPKADYRTETHSGRDQTTLQEASSMPRHKPFAMVDATKPAGLKFHRSVQSVIQICEEGLKDLNAHIQGGTRDMLFLLLATALTAPVMMSVNLSPIIGFMVTGCLLGPNGLGVISDLHSIEMLAELGIVLFLFEMGLELSLDRLASMKKDVFGLGGLQMVLSTAILGIIANFAIPGITAASALVVGGGLALSSSAFALQILRDNQDLGTRQGRAAFGILLFQDLAIVPMLVGLPLLAGSGVSVGVAMFTALVKGCIAISAISFTGAFLLNPMFEAVEKSKSHTSFLALAILTVLSMSFVTEGLGLSNTLGAFLAGVLLSETKYKYQVEADIAPFRGLLLGLFFTTVGFSIDFTILSAQFPFIMASVGGLLFAKSAAIFVLCRAFNLRTSQSLQAGLLLSQGGEFAFVVFGLAKRIGLLSEPISKFLLTTTAISMAATPALSALGNNLATKLETSTKQALPLKDKDSAEIISEGDFVIVCGHGRIGKVVCDVLDEKLLKYIVLDSNPGVCYSEQRKIYFGDASRREVLQSFGIDRASFVISTIDSMEGCDSLISSLKRFYPDKPVIACAANQEHMGRLLNETNVKALLPYTRTATSLEDTFYDLNIQFGGAVLKAMGYDSLEVDAIVKDIRLRTALPTRYAADSVIKTVMESGSQAPILFIPTAGQQEGAEAEHAPLTLPESMIGLPWKDRVEAIFALLDNDLSGTVDFNQLASSLIRDNAKVDLAKDDQRLSFRKVATTPAGRISLDEFFRYVEEAKSSSFGESVSVNAETIDVDFKTEFVADAGAQGTGASLVIDVENETEDAETELVDL